MIQYVGFLLLILLLIWLLPICKPDYNSCYDHKSIFNITPEELQKAMDIKLQRERNKQR